VAQAVTRPPPPLAGVATATGAVPFAGPEAGPAPRAVRVPATAAGDPAAGTMPHRNRLRRASATAAVTGPGRGAVAADRRAPAVVTRSPSSRSSISTLPSRSVRYTRAPESRRRASVEPAGWPYEFPVPAEATATRGRTASRNPCVVAVALP
jgi:hypothetical protein